MSSPRLTTLFAVLAALLLGIDSPAMAPPHSKPASKPKPAPVKKPAAAKPKPKPSAAQAHTAAGTHAKSTVHQVRHNYYAGRSARSRTWYAHHQHRRYVYQVRYRVRGAGERVFPTQVAAQTYRHWLHQHHLHASVHHPADGLWTVNFWGSHVRPFGTYASLPVARRVELTLRSYGFASWIHSHRVYF